MRLPSDLARFLSIAKSAVGDFVPLRTSSSFGALLGAAQSGDEASRARLLAQLAGDLPFGATRTGELWLYAIASKASPARAVVAVMDPHAPIPRPVCRGAAAFAVICSLHASVDEDEDTREAAHDAAERIAAPGVAEQEAVASAFERARVVLDLLAGSDPAVRRAARTLARKPMEHVSPPDTRRLRDRESPLALGALVEVFFRADADEARSAAADHEASDDAIVAETARVLRRALEPSPKGAATSELARRRALALRSIRTTAPPLTKRASDDGLELTRAIMAKLDATPPALDPLTTPDERAETLLALAEHGDRAVVPSLVARAVTGDIAAVEMLGLLGDARAIPHLVAMLGREPQRHRHLETAVVRALGRLRAKGAALVLRRVLADNPMSSWREGIERAVFVREVVSTLGALRDEQAGPALVAILESTSQEYRAILPTAAWSLGRMGHAPALRALERLLCSPKEPVTPEALWAVGEIGRRHANVKKRAGALLDGCVGLEPGAEMTRLTGLAKIRGTGTPRWSGPGNAPRPQELRRALERALWEPGFRQEETYKRRTWALRSLRDLRAVSGSSSRAVDDPYFLGHEAVRYLVTRDDYRVRHAAEKAFAAWSIPLPKTRRYYAVLVEELERDGGLEALHDAVRDPLGVYRHNVATRLGELADPRSARPLAEATARLFAEPPTSTYEYDDAPNALVAFVRALAKLNRPEGNDVLIEGVRSGNHQVRAVVAENAPEDERFVPELQAMLGDPRSFLRSRAERSLALLGAMPSASERTADAPPRIVEV